MTSQDPIAGGSNHVGNRPLKGIAIVALIYLLQIIGMRALAVPLNQSVMAIIVYPVILVIGWLSCGLIMGATIFSRSIGGWRFVCGLLMALFTSFLSVILFQMSLSGANMGGP